MKDIHSVIREKEQQVRQLMEQIDKLRCAAQILEDEQNPLGSDESLRVAAAPKGSPLPHSAQTAHRYEWFVFAAECH